MIVNPSNLKGYHYGWMFLGLFAIVLSASRCSGDVDAPKAEDKKFVEVAQGLATGGTYACETEKAIRSFYDAMQKDNINIKEWISEANRNCIKMGEGWTVEEVPTSGDGQYIRIKSPDNFTGELWTSPLSITEWKQVRRSVNE